VKDEKSASISARNVPITYGIQDLPEEENDKKFDTGKDGRND
jgi:hypothetical protein